ncbi:branched-chain amino acid ABC transporter permease [Xenophilus azovorans]|uniref:branched-chain amino acid ABC transporter permease n=1 Tax=Xenophilus azovorans TaxID=151755 RepID=UPI00057037CA|nr:branched-chain amino acid ABC transporter permease [Xenophilus azovorans]
MELLLQLAVNGIANGSTYALLAVAWALIFSTTRVVHFAFGPFYTLAAYLVWSAAMPLKLPLALAAVLGIAAAALAGVLSYLLLYRSFEKRNAPPVVVMIVSLGLFMMLENAIAIGFGTSAKVVQGLQLPVLLLGPVFVTSVQLLQVASLAVVGGALAWFLARARSGQAIVAMTDNLEMARIIGIDTFRVSILVFAIGTAISAVCATQMLLRDGAVPHMGFPAVFIAFVGVFVGGVGSLRGAALAGMLLGLVENVGMWGIPTEWQGSISFALLFAILLVRPTGLFGARS